MNGNSGLIWVLLAIFGVFGLGALFLGKSKTLQTEIEEQDIDILMFDNIVRWFKTKSIEEIIKSNKNYSATVLKGYEAKKYFNKTTDKHIVVASVFDESKGDIVKAKVFKANKIDGKLREMFGDKDLIVLK